MLDILELESEILTGVVLQSDKVEISCAKVLCRKSCGNSGIQLTRAASTKTEKQA